MTNARILTEYIEATTTPSSAPRQIDTLYLEATSTGTPARQLGEVYVETATAGTPARQLETVYVEVLSQTYRKFRGWGIPL